VRVTTADGLKERERLAVALEAIRVPLAEGRDDPAMANGVLLSEANAELLGVAAGAALATAQDTNTPSVPAPGGAPAKGSRKHAPVTGTASAHVVPSHAPHSVTFAPTRNALS